MVVNTLACRLLRLGIVALCINMLAYIHAERLQAQNSSAVQGVSCIVRIKPGVQLKVVREALHAALSQLSSNVSSNIPFPANNARAVAHSAYRLDRYIVIRADGILEATLTHTLGSVDGVEEVFPNHIYTINASPNDSLYAEQWGLRAIEAEGAWEITSGEPDVLVGVIDTGIEFDHPDLVNALAINVPEDINNSGRFEPWPATVEVDGKTGDLDGIDQDGNGFADDVIGYDFTDQTVPNVGDWSERDPVPADEFNHGTAVAGVIAATRNNSAGISGIAPGVRIVSLRAFDATGNAEDDDMSAAVVYAVDRGVKILNLSFGDSYSSPLLHDAIRYAYAKGVSVVASSGNDGVPDIHYPSGYPEVISVGATDSLDRLSTFSTYGSQLSLVAPGVSIMTTDLNGEYSRQGGTSFSAPYVAGVAALLLSVHPDWTPDEIRSVLELSADNLGPRGWDINFGAGRLNARRALASPGPATSAINEPGVDIGFSIDTIVTVVGSASAPFLDYWELSVGYGELPNSWIPLIERQVEGRVQDVLGELDTRQFPDTTITLRLLVALTNGHTTERRVRLFIDRTKPRILSQNIRNIWRNLERALAITIRTDDLTRVTAWLRKKGGTGQTYVPFEMEPERVGLTRNHYIYLSDVDMERGAEYDMYVEARNTVGDTTRIGSPAQPLLVTRQIDAFPSTTLQSTSKALPYGFLLNGALPLPRTGDKSVLLNRFSGTAFDSLVLYQYTPEGFVQAAITGNWAPRGVGDSDGDGLLEVLGQASSQWIVYEQATPEGSPFATIQFADTTTGKIFPGAFYDVDNDGQDELIAYSGEQQNGTGYYFVGDWNGSGYIETARLPNPTAPARGFSRNELGASDAVAGDFNGNGLTDILFADNDGDFIVYERALNGDYRLLWTSENNGNESDRMIASGDLDGDGVDEIITGYRSSFQLNSDNEYDAPLWTFRGVKLDTQGNGVVIWEGEFAYTRSSNPFRAGVDIGELNGAPGGELAISIFPNMYVFTWDATLQQLRPFWWRGASIINKPLMQDFDGNGLAELGIGDGDTIRFYQLDSKYPGPQPPTGMQGWALNDSTAFIEWNPVVGAEAYQVYRGLRGTNGGQIQYVRITSTTATQLVDTGMGLPEERLAANQPYGYYVTTIDTDKPQQESMLGDEVIVFTHVPARITSATPLTGRSVQIQMSVSVKETLYRNGAFSVMDGNSEVRISTITTEREDALIITLDNDYYGRELVIRPTALFRDRYETPADTTVTVTLLMPDKEPIGELFIATRAYADGQHKIVVEYNAPVDGVTGTDVLHYAIQPAGQVIAVEASEEFPSRICIIMAPEYLLGAFGKDYVITITGIQAEDGRLLNDGSGSVVAFTVNAEDLESVYVYPHPFSIARDGVATFAGLTREATINIYTQSGRAIRSLEAREGNGGVEWNGLDDSGREVPPGIYLYKVTGETASGSTYESPPRKIAIVP